MEEAAFAICNDIVTLQAQIAALITEVQALKTAQTAAFPGPQPAPTTLNRSHDGKLIVLNYAMWVVEGCETLDTKTSRFNTGNITQVASMNGGQPSITTADHPTASLPMDLDALELAQDQCANCKGFGQWL